MDAELIQRLRDYTKRDMELSPEPEKVDQRLVGHDFLKNRDFAVLTHEYCANSASYHGHTFFEINYLVSGTCFQNLDNKETVVLQPGNVCIMNPNAMHACRIQSESDVLVNLLVDPRLFNGAFFSFFSNNTLIGSFFMNYVLSQATDEGNYLLFRTPCDPYTDTLVEQIIREYLSDNPYAQLNIRNLLNLFFSELLHHSLMKEKKEPEKIEEIMNYIAYHLDAASLKEVAGHFYMSPNYLSAYVKRHTGKSFSEVVTAFRLAQAKHLLISTNLSPEKISELMGYAEVLSFHNMFKRNTGLTPTQYRKENREG